VRREALVEAIADHHEIHKVIRGSAICTEMEKLVQSVLSQQEILMESQGK